MVDLRKYARRLQGALGKENAAGGNSADRIDEGVWKGVIEELDKMSIECAKEIQQETGLTYNKPAREGKAAYTLGFEEAPPHLFRIRNQRGLKTILKSSLFILLTAESACILTAETIDLIFYQYSLPLSVSLALLAGAFTVVVPAAYRKTRQSNER